MVTSIYDQEFDEPLNNRLHDKLAWDGINKSDLEVISDPTYPNFVKLAINFSDGVIFGSKEINPALKNYAEKKSLPTLEYHDETSYIGAYSDFYDKILS
jgi:starch synthase